MLGCLDLIVLAAAALWIVLADRAPAGNHDWELIEALPERVAAKVPVDSVR